MSRKCPKCGAPLFDEITRCLSCDWVDTTKVKKRNVCPECGDILTRGVCYRCGYRKRFSYNTCPYCKQKLINYRCEKCGYKSSRGFFSNFLFRIIEFIIIIAVIFFLLRMINF